MAYLSSIETIRMHVVPEVLCHIVGSARYGALRFSVGCVRGCDMVFGVDFKLLGDFSMEFMFHCIDV